LHQRNVFFKTSFKNITAVFKKKGERETYRGFTVKGESSKLWAEGGQRAGKTTGIISALRPPQIFLVNVMVIF